MLAILKSVSENPTHGVRDSNNTLNLHLTALKFEMARKEGSILIVDDNNDLLIALRLILSPTFTTIDTLRNPNLILSTLEKQAYDIILLDMNFKAGQNTGNEGIFWMNKILEREPEATVVFITKRGPWIS
jgi:DNA-binding NtrC family response regulator